MKPQNFKNLEIDYTLLPFYFFGFEIFYSGMVWGLGEFGKFWGVPWFFGPGIFLLEVKGIFLAFDFLLPFNHSSHLNCGMPLG